MLRKRSIAALFLGLGLTVAVSPGQNPQGPKVQLLLSELQPGSLASNHHCTLLYSDHRFHDEVATLKHGRELDRKAYEGQLSEADWNEIMAILDRKDFRDLDIPRPLAKIVMQESHIYVISVARADKFQNMEFLDTKSLKPYEKELEPLLQWWKAFNHRSMTKSDAPPSKLCALNNNNAVFSQ